MQVLFIVNERQNYVVPSSSNRSHFKCTHYTLGYPDTHIENRKKPRKFRFYSHQKTLASGTEACS
jgi:hypothetical protein